MKRKNVIMLSVSLLILLAGCGETKQVQKPVRSVKIQKVGLDEACNGKIVLPASVSELKEVNLAFRVGGPLVELNNTVGSYVKKGDVIAKIDSRDFKIAVESAQTQYLHAKAEYERYKNLLAKNSASKSLFDQMEANYKLSKIAFESARNALNDTEIKAPFSGYINIAFVENFEKINPGAPIVSLLDLSSFEVNAWISAHDMNHINSKTEFVCVVKNGKYHRLKAKIKEIGSKSSFSKQSYPITVVVEVPSDFKLRAGMTAKLEISNNIIQDKSKITIPVVSVFSKEEKTFVWIFNEKTSKVSLREVKLGSIVSDHNIEILEGLNNNESIVTAGVHYLQEGQEVKKMIAFTDSNIGNQL